MKILEDRVNNGTIGMLYGPPGIGKSTIASKSANPVFVDVEDGISLYGFKRTPVIKDYTEFLEALRFLVTTDYQTIVIDTLDKLENMLLNHVLKANGWKSIEEPGYGKGYTIAQMEWDRVITALSYLKEKGKNVVLLAHEQVKTYTPPDSDSYERFSPKMNPKNANILFARLDYLLYCHFEIIVTSGKDGKTRAISTDKRVAETMENAAWVSKNRFGLSKRIPFTADIWQYLQPVF